MTRICVASRPPKMYFSSVAVDLQNGRQQQGREAEERDEGRAVAKAYQVPENRCKNVLKRRVR